MVTSSLIYYLLNGLNLTVDVREVCVFLAPVFSSFTVIVAYHFGKEAHVSCAQLRFEMVFHYLHKSVHTLQIERDSEVSNKQKSLN